ncbi:hypothetical protein BGZ54_003865 [Gamsiella multidivaricata]|nr:hypothetical protein BGZ54_003865 [Gamsiella multidivaricata]
MSDLLDSVANAAMLYPGVAFGLAIFVGYLLLVRHLRYQRINALLKKYPDPTLPLRDRNVAKEVSSNFADIDFPFLNVVSLEFALFKTYAIPSISKILAATRQFKDSCSKRTEDTTLILQEMSEGYARKQFREIIERRVDEEEDKNDERREFIATERLNFIHGHYPIKQEDYLYTLALFVLEPHIWISRFEWRESTELERNATLAIWQHHGERMKIRNIPRTVQELEEWTEEYERSHMVYANTNVAIAEVTTDLLLSLAPSFTHAFGRQVVSALLSDRLRTAFAIPPPPAGLTTVIVGALKLRAFFVRHFMLPRRYPNVRTALRANEENKYVPLWNKYAPVYPDGYKVEDLGPAKFLGKCPMSLKGIVQDTTHVESRFKAV